MAVIAVDDLAYFRRLLYSHQKVVVDFSANWCGPCRQMGPVFYELSGKYNEILFLSVDIDNAREIAREYRVTSLPTFILFNGGYAISSVMGANKQALEQGIKSL
ncbi:hypothetical protein GGI20_001953 [Coemansia sp. BCRC 34301]|nr:hypothetical protein GGI20_001953 [Coemansia sp. BCRC 34301]